MFGYNWTTNTYLSCLMSYFVFYSYVIFNINNIPFFSLLFSLFLFSFSSSFSPFLSFSYFPLFLLLFFLSRRIYASRGLPSRVCRRSPSEQGSTRRTDECASVRLQQQMRLFHNPISPHPQRNHASVTSLTCFV